MGLKGAARIDLDQRLVQASLEIASGKSFYDVLRRNGITHFTLKKNLHRLPSFPGLVEDKHKKKTLENIAADPSRLFLVSEDELKYEYERVSTEQQQRMNSRNYHHPYNRQFIAYYAVISTLPSAIVFLGKRFSKDDRDLLVSEILGDSNEDNPGIPNNHRRFFRERHLNYLMFHYTGDIRSSPQNIWQLVDGYYIRKTGDASLFDQTKKSHLPDIERTGWGRILVLRNPDIMASRVYDVLTKKTQVQIAKKLSSLNRKTVIEGLDDLVESAGSMVGYFRKLGLGGAMAAGFNGKNKYSPKSIYQAFDYQYHKISKDKHSLFDMNQPDFSPLMDEQVAFANPKYANKAIYGRLVRMNPKNGELAILSADSAVRGIKKLPHNLTVHLKEQGFRKIIKHTYLKDLPLAQAVITGYANHLRRITHGVIKLLDYISFDNSGKLQRY